MTVFSGRTWRRGRGAGRRVLAVAAAGALALGGLAACTDDSLSDELAATVGELEITEAEIDRIADAVRDELGGDIERELESLAGDEALDLSEDDLAAHQARRYTDLEEQMSVTRTRVLEMRILTEVAARYADQHDLEIPEPMVEHQAYELGLGEDNEYVRVVADFFAHMTLLQRQVEPVEPSEQAQREAYDHLVDEGLTSADFDEAREVLTAERMGAQEAIRDLLTELIADAPVRVHDRYDLVYQLPIPLGSGESWLNVPLDADAAA